MSLATRIAIPASLGCLALFAAASCGGKCPPLSVTATLQNAVANPEHILFAPDAGEGQRTTVQRAIDATREIVTSPNFAAALSGYDELATRVNGDSMKGSDVLSTFLSPTAKTLPLRTEYIFLDGNCSRQTASTGVLIELTARTTFSDGVTDAGLAFATTNLNLCTLTRAGATDRAEFACAVNTIAHEWSHSVVDAADNCYQQYQDKGHSSASSGLVSYTVGAVAQCVYLNLFYRVFSEGSVRDIDGCVQAVGTTFFDPSTCHDEWATKKFGKRLGEKGEKLTREQFD